MKKEKIAFSLMEMMVVMLVLTIIIAASIPLITRRVNHRPEVVYKVITIQVPSTQNESKVVNTTTLKGSDAKNNLDKMVSAQKDNLSRQNSPKQEVVTIAQGNILSQEVVNMEMVQDDSGELQTVVTLSSGKKVVVGTDEKGQTTMKEYKK